jgi:hypothetical protein
MIAVHVEELDDAQQFTKIDLPIPRIVVAGVGGATLIGSWSGRIAVFRAGLAMEAMHVEELNDAQQFTKIDVAVMILVSRQKL